jgi:hypothetical protein
VANPALFKAMLEAIPQVVTNLPGGIWDRRIMRDVSTNPSTHTPGSTPGAFTVPGGQIKRCVAIVPQVESANVPSGPPGTYLDSVELWFWCLPHASEKAIIDETISIVKRTIENRNIVTLTTGAHLRWAGTLPFFDDIDVGNAVSKRVTVQINGVWR